MRRFIYCQGNDIFLRKFKDGEISEKDIVFIEDLGAIWTNGCYFGTSYASSNSIGVWE